MTSRILIYTYLIFIVLTLNGCLQKPYDNELVSDEKELNFLFSDKRGIKSDDGIVYFVQADGLTLTAYIENEVKWTVDFINTCEEPIIKNPKIQYIGLSGDKIQLIFEKRNFATIDVQDGKTKYRCGD